MTDITSLTIGEILAGLRGRQFSSVELTQAYLDRIDRLEPTIHAYITVTPERALEDARRADQRRAAGEDAPLLGVPLGIKDVLSTRGVETTCASKILEGYVPIFDATVVERLYGAGMVMLGKLNMDEFAMGSSTENSAYGVTRNPWDTERVPGGSSGGSAAAVAAGLAAGTLGTDTGGSIRQPSSLCGITALKPSYGRVSRYGLIAFGSSLDQAGPMTRTVEDAARILQVIAGHDPRDGTSQPAPAPDYLAEMTAGGQRLDGLRVGVPKEYFVAGMQPDVEAAVRAAIAHLESLGASIVEVSLPHTEYSLPVYYLLATSEASTNLARFDGVRFGKRVETGDMWDNYRRTRALFGAEVKRRIMLGTYALSAGYYDAFYGKATQVRTLIKRDFDQAFEQVDVLVSATSPTTAFKLGENTEDPLAMYLADVLTISANLGGVCGLNVPCGFDQAGLPIGMQLLGPALGESAVLRVGHVYQTTTDFHTRRPVL
ncbi:MAG: Asp-tRNA(Asn)/Glu-tRNA(Gln) amidotransferase subunit GatA [Anaerolineae bacterium]|nr:MAG: aspartyl/glutamyl-tRNA amidotransferase subunit A [Chloroflexi bacterium OLB13]MBV6436326.1 Glutamyl-tRNA(Gln) amidotransferase subunit A [Anaerolineae bacterium]MDL1914802.1 Asp-tRNA(Asn)/Glu-tRNA(Gln) amidotransferase subunit GatA [Anaerolineae bacterium CFX4]MEB2365785.1 Asp-tRNA(Asn)/Glu-tRNA(Gln) amidotransferase subunit GatA [Chloroflexota bacterium]OQY85306.1 MAG: aspartyl/glutamyl-tRNA amidotransferase subunit A [Anaerolineae bacterium UTCFX5]